MSGIIWDNIGLDLRQRTCRKLVIWGLAIALIVVALILMVNFTNYTTELTAAAPKVDCANKTIDADLAWRDFETVPNLRNSDLHCFCKKTLDSHGNIDPSIIIFQAFNSTLPPDHSPCVEWKFAYDNNFYLVIIAGIILGAINGICVFLFETIVHFEGCVTYMDLTIAQIERITIIQYVNIALVLIFAEFNLGSVKKEDSGLVLNGRFRDFDSAWY